jgi:hypothetical protein
MPRRGCGVAGRTPLRLPFLAPKGLSSRAGSLGGRVTSSTSSSCGSLSLYVSSSPSRRLFIPVAFNLELQDHSDFSFDKIGLIPPPAQLNAQNAPTMFALDDKALNKHTKAAVKLASSSKQCEGCCASAFCSSFLPMSPLTSCEPADTVKHPEIHLTCCGRCKKVGRMAWYCNACVLFLLSSPFFPPVLTHIARTVSTRSSTGQSTSASAVRRSGLLVLSRMCRTGVEMQGWVRETKRF